jgi:hypothetical protein
VSQNRTRLSCRRPALERRVENEVAVPGVGRPRRCTVAIGISRRCKPPPLALDLVGERGDPGGTVAAIRGMPLGRPPIPLEDIQLVETWIAEGRPQ